MSPIGSVSRVSPVHTAMRNCTRDEGGPFEVGNRHHTNCPWVLLYIERWLKAPMQMEDGSVVPRTAGTPQGGVVSPSLANLFLHYAFDMWMKRTYPHIPFERYADGA